MSEQTYIRIIPELLERFEKFLMPDEKLIIGFPCGRVMFGQENVNPVVAARNKDYLIVTDQRLMYIEKEWFQSKRGFSVIPMKLVRSVDAKTFLMGSNLSIEISDGKTTRVISIENGPKREIEATYKFLKSRMERQVCPQCKNPVPEGQYNFCPNCNKQVAAECRSCGRELGAEWIICPFCASR